MANINTDIAMLTETKLTTGCHVKTGHGYLVFASLATSPSQGGVALIWQMAMTHWTLSLLLCLHFCCSFTFFVLCHLISADLLFVLSF